MNEKESRTRERGEKGVVLIVNIIVLIVAIMLYVNFYVKAPVNAIHQQETLLEIGQLQTQVNVLVETGQLSQEEVKEFSKTLDGLNLEDLKDALKEFVGDKWTYKEYLHYSIHR